MEPTTASEATTAKELAGAYATSVAAPDCAHCLRETGNLLQEQGANPHRVAAYRKAAEAIAALDHAAICGIVERDGIDGLDRLPHIGRGIATAIVEMVRTGHWSQLERLRGTSDPAQLFTVVPGLGHRLAERIHEELHIDTLEALEFAALDGRLEHVPGVGPRRAAAIRASLHTMLVRQHGRGLDTDPRSQPSVRLMLAIDRQYREQGAAGALPTIAPTRYNLTQDAWLPVLHCERDGWQFTAMFLNTAQAHQLNRTRDWVRVYFYDSENIEGQQTVITETHGALAGRRVVRGREAECRAQYAAGY
jgi:Holliday junction resolvasome RuvABC DNA-binding subunit